MPVGRRPARRARRCGRASWPSVARVPSKARPAEVLRRLVELERDAVDLLDLVLADVADPHLAERGVEPEAPRVAQPGQHDVASAASRRVDVGGQQLAEQVARVLRGALAGRTRRRRRRGRGTAGRRGRRRAGRRCGSPRAARRAAARGAAGRSCRACAELGDARVAARVASSAGTGGGWSAKSGWKAMPSRPCSAPVLTSSRRSSSDGAPAAVRCARTRPGCSSTHSAPGSPGAAPTHVGRMRPVAIALDVEVRARGRSRVAGGGGSASASESPLGAERRRPRATASAATAARTHEERGARIREP